MSSKISATCSLFYSRHFANLFDELEQSSTWYRDFAVPLNANTYYEIGKWNICKTAEGAINKVFLRALSIYTYIV